MEIIQQAIITTGITLHKLFSFLIGAILHLFFAVRITELGICGYKVNGYCRIGILVAIFEFFISFEAVPCILGDF